MKTLIKGLLVIISTSILLCSCAKEMENNCTFISADMSIEPFCAFLPSAFPETPFPVRVLNQGSGLHSPEYTFKWTSDPDFGGSAISVTYEMLPLTVEVTEVASDCKASVTLTSAYWE